MDVYTDHILNHAGFSDLGTVDTKGTPSTADDVTFAQAGGYPGLAITLPGDIDGDFHGAFESGVINGRLRGWSISPRRSRTNSFAIRWRRAIRRTFRPGPRRHSCRQANVPNPNNAQFYPDQGLGGVPLDADPGPGEFLITRYDFNLDSPLSGDPVLETAEQLLLRHSQWMVQVIGVDGFRLDAAKHFPTNTLTLLDQAVFRASKG